MINPQELDINYFQDDNYLHETINHLNNVDGKNYSNNNEISNDQNSNILNNTTTTDNTKYSTINLSLLENDPFIPSFNYNELIEEDHEYEVFNNITFNNKDIVKMENEEIEEENSNSIINSTMNNPSSIATTPSNSTTLNSFSENLNIILNSQESNSNSNSNSTSDCASPFSSNNSFITSSSTFDKFMVDDNEIDFFEEYNNYNKQAFNLNFTIDSNNLTAQKINFENNYKKFSNIGTESTQQKRKYNKSSSDGTQQKQVRKKRASRNSTSSLDGGNKKVSDSRLSAQGLAQVLNLKSPEEALKRERFILDIFEFELHYPLGYKTWIRDTEKNERSALINELYQRVNKFYPEYDRNILETIIRRATYYMMQSRLRKERKMKRLLTSIK